MKKILTFAVAFLALAASHNAINAKDSNKEVLTEISKEQPAEMSSAIVPGKKFIDFKMKDIDGKMHKLSEYVGNGKVVVIDFWASWCPPCRRDMPNMVNLYKKYKDKGFELVGISLDSEKEKWAKGIENLNITWPQLSDLQGWQNEGARLYGVNSIPTTILVDKDGTVVALNLHGAALDAEIAKLLQ